MQVLMHRIVFFQPGRFEQLQGTLRRPIVTPALRTMAPFRPFVLIQHTWVSAVPLSDNDAFPDASADHGTGDDDDLLRFSRSGSSIGVRGAGGDEFFG